MLDGRVNLRVFLIPIHCMPYHLLMLMVLYKIALHFLFLVCVPLSMASEHFLHLVRWALVWTVWLLLYHLPELILRFLSSKIPFFGWVR